MNNDIVSNKRIAKNTMMLYIRMLLSVVVSLYTSRVILEVLGVEDYGLYGGVGGVVAMFSFLNASMAGATSRFLTFELGKGNYLRLKETFASALIIHIGIALVVLVCAESIGLWFLYNKLVIPEGRIYAAQWVYQCAVISAILGITQVPYNALIIAHERMDVYAYIEMLSVFLRLVSVYLLTIFNFDKLKLYAVLVLVVSSLVIMIYRIYCINNFSESRFKFTFNKNIIKPMLSFTCWDFYGNMCVTSRIQGTNFLINNFFGVVANASSNIATTVNGVLKGFASNIITAFRPRIIKYYSQQNWAEMQSMINNAIKFSTLFLMVLTLPIILETSYIINLWLGELPDFVVPFVRLTLISQCIETINLVIVICIHATGKIKRISLLTGTLFLLTIPISYIFLRTGCNITVVYVVNFVSNIIIVLLNLSILKKQVIEISILSILKVIATILLVTTLTLILSLIVYHVVPLGFYRLVAVTISVIIAMAFFTYLIALNTNQRNYVKYFIKNKLHKLHH